MAYQLYTHINKRQTHTVTQSETANKLYGISHIKD